MATYAIAASERAAHAKTLVGSTVDTVTFAGRPRKLAVVSLDGLAAIYFTTDGTTPTVAGAGSYVLPAAIGERVLSLDEEGLPDGAPVTVKLISSGAPTYSVTVA